MLRPSAMGALTLLWAGTTDEGLTQGGKVISSLFNVPSSRGTYAFYFSILFPGHGWVLQPLLHKTRNLPRNYGRGWRNRCKTFNFIFIPR